MKANYIFLIFTLVFSGCANKNAFSKFNMQKEQELSAASIQSSKIIYKEKISGVFSAIYLNEVYPNTYNQHEYFFVYIYLKEPKDLYNPNFFLDNSLTIKLNEKSPIKIQEVKDSDKFNSLTSRKNKWNRYYIVAFEEQGDVLNLILQNKEAKSSTLIYYKNEE